MFVLTLNSMVRCVVTIAAVWVQFNVRLCFMVCDFITRFSLELQVYGCVQCCLFTVCVFILNFDFFLYYL